MARLYGREWTRDELRKRVGEMAQVAEVRSARLEGGRADGVRSLEFNAGDGLRFTALPDRCMDIPSLEYRGVPLVWSARNGIVAPQYYEPEGSQWLRSFFGGLVTTCRLRQVGQPCEDAGERLGLHGRIGSTPAEQVWAGAAWEGDEYVLRACGTMRETSVFREDLRLRRKIAVRMGERRLTLRDRVENLGSEASPFMLLYHVNAGFPLLGPGARLIAADRDVRPKDEHSRAGLAEHARFGLPQQGWSEQNYWHDVRPDAEGYCRAAIVNDGLALPFATGIGLAVRWRRDQLWNLVEWKQLGEGDYVVAIEPANCHTLGRAKERELGTLEHIGPGETREFDLEFAVLVGREEIAAFEAAQPAG